MLSLYGFLYIIYDTVCEVCEGDTGYYIKGSSPGHQDSDHTTLVSFPTCQSAAPVTDSSHQSSLESEITNNIQSIKSTE